MDIRAREMQYRWLDTPSEPVVIYEVPRPEPTPHPKPNDPPATADSDRPMSHSGLGEASSRD